MRSVRELIRDRIAELKTRADKAKEEKNDGIVMDSFIRIQELSALLRRLRK